MPNFIERLLGGDNEYHRDGGRTERFEDGTSKTYDSDGKLTESSYKDYHFFRGEVTVTRDADWNTINVQQGWGDDDE